MGIANAITKVRDALGFTPDDDPLAREKAIAGELSHWPPPSTAEMITLDGKQIPAAHLLLRDLAGAMAGIFEEMKQHAGALGIRLPIADCPARPVETAELDGPRRTRARRLNLLSLQLRAVNARTDQLIAADESRERASREVHLEVLRALLVELPPKMQARSIATGDLHERAERIGQFLEDVAVLGRAAARHAQDNRLRELLQKAAEVVGERCPELPASTLPARFDGRACQHLAQLLNVQLTSDPAAGALMARAQQALKVLTGTPSKPAPPAARVVPGEAFTIKTRPLE